MLYDALLLMSFGGPERPEDVIPFLENVLRGRPVSRERMLEVAEHYYHFGGVSPINAQNRALIRALEAEFAQHGPSLRVYWGNRNWQPFVADTIRLMMDEGVRRALVLVTSSHGSYSGCRQYREDIERARQEVGPGAPAIDKLRLFYNHPGFISAVADRVHEADRVLPAERREAAPLVFTAHSVPLVMASACDYQAQLEESCRLVAELLGRQTWTLVFQSRSGSPTQPWLGPDICDHLRGLAADGVADVIVAPIGFLSDHMEVIYDLDTQAGAICQALGVRMIRAGTVGDHPSFVSMIRELVLERLEPGATRRALGARGAAPDVCAGDCCLLDSQAGRK